MRVSWLLSCLPWLAGCAASTTLPIDAGHDAPAVDVGIDAGAPDTHCSVDPVPPNVPAFTADFRLNDATIGTVVPTMTGGDPVGTWLFDHGTFWVDHTNDAMFNRWGSSVGGTAWIAIDATDFRLEYDFVTTLAGTQLGTIVQEDLNRAHARWRLDREQIEPTGLVCAESSQMAYGDPGRVTFTRVDATHLTMLVEVPMQAGLTILELHGTLAP